MVDLLPGHLAVLVDHVRCAGGDAHLLDVGVVLAGHGALRMEVREQMRSEVLVTPEGLERERAVHRDAEYLGAAVGEPVGQVRNVVELLGADAAESQWIEDQHHVVPAQRGERDLFALFVPEGEVRSLRSNFYGHLVLLVGCWLERSAPCYCGGPQPPQASALPHSWRNRDMPMK